MDSTTLSLRASSELAESDAYKETQLAAFKYLGGLKLTRALLINDTDQETDQGMNYRRRRRKVTERKHRIYHNFEKFLATAITSKVELSGKDALKARMEQFKSTDYANLTTNETRHVLDMCIELANDAITFVDDWLKKKNAAALKTRHRMIHVHEQVDSNPAADQFVFTAGDMVQSKPCLQLPSLPDRTSPSTSIAKAYHRTQHYKDSGPQGFEAEHLVEGPIQTVQDTVDPIFGWDCPVPKEWTHLDTEAFFQSPNHINQNTVSQSLASQPDLGEIPDAEVPVFSLKSVEQTEEYKWAGENAETDNGAGEHFGIRTCV